MNTKIVLVTAGSLNQDYVHEFTRAIVEIPNCGGHVNLFAKDYINFVRKFSKPPTSLDELRAFVYDKTQGDPEKYLFSDQYQKENGFLLKQVIPFRFLFEFVNSERLGECCYAKQKDEPLDVARDVKIFCPSKLVSDKPSQMRDNLAQYVL